MNGGIGWDGNLNYFPWWIGTVGEAIALISYERNADRIPGTFYVSPTPTSLPKKSGGNPTAFSCDESA